jgi:hypothetical protein
LVGWRYRRVPDDYADPAAVLAADTTDVIVTHLAKQIVHVPAVFAQRIRVIQRIDEAKIWVLIIFAGNGGVGRLDV